MSCDTTRINNIEYKYHITHAMLSIHNGEVRISVNKFE